MFLCKESHVFNFADCLLLKNQTATLLLYENFHVQHNNLFDFLLIIVCDNFVNGLDI